MNRWRNILFLVLFGFLFIEILVIFPKRLERSGNVEDKQIEFNDQPQGPDQTMQKIQVVESQQGSRDWELFAEAAEGSQKQAVWKLRTVKVNFYHEGAIEYVITGDRGEVEGQSKDMRIEGNVVTTSANGYIFKSEKANYLSQSRQIEVPGPVETVGPADDQGEGMTMTGVGMKVWIDKSLIKIESQVKAQRKLRDGQPVTIESDWSELSSKSREAKFFGQVVLGYEGLRIRGPSAIFSYHKKSNLLQTIFMEGGVKAEDGDKSATSENLTADVLHEKILLKGQPKLFQGEDVINGDEITLLENGRKVKVDRVRSRIVDGESIGR